MQFQNIALIYEDQSRPETTGGYCLRALRQFTTVEHFRPADLDRITRRGFDLYLRIDDGFDYRLPVDLRPSAWWIIDTHLNFEQDLKRANDFDLVFTAQRDGATALREKGIASASWLPLACDPILHARHDVAKEWDICFVGNIFPGPRAELIARLQKQFSPMFVGKCFFEEMARTYSASRLVFNRSIRNDVNMRVFEAVACGSLLMTNDLADNGQAELFRDGVHLAVYRDQEELLDKVRFYLGRDRLREQIAAAGYAEVLSKHTYRHRMESLLAEAERWLRASVTVQGKVSASPVRVSPPTPTIGSPLGPDRSYYEYTRPELLARIPHSAQHILDIGCGAGRLGASLKARQSVEVVGIEWDATAVDQARSRLDRVLCADVEKLNASEFTPGAFAAVVCGDVLEHLRDPETLLRQVREWLTPDGQLIASIPNVRHHSIVRGLIQGDWTYESAGLLDRTHLRFFTLRSIRDLFAQCGYEIESIATVPGPWDGEASEQIQIGKVHAGQFRLEGLTPEEAAEFFAYQFLIVARRSQQVSTESVGRLTVLQPATTSLPGIGCVLAVRDRPADFLKRTLQTYAYQTLQPVDRVLLDYGSTAESGSAYKELCVRFGWRYVSAASPVSEWSLSDAYNQAITALVPGAVIVFKNDVDVLLGENVLAVAAEQGRDRLCLFSRLTTKEGTTYPARFASHADLIAFRTMDDRLTPMESEGVQAFPRRWFEEIGGFDRAYRGWGYEDSDLRLRAEWSIGTCCAEDVLLIHQGHSQAVRDARTIENHAYYESTKASRRVVRNQNPVSVQPVWRTSKKPDLRIPQIIHQIWVGPNPMPASFAGYQASWKRCHPDWEFRLWTDANLPPMQNTRLFEQTTVLAQRADILRYELMLQFGGIYIDVDFECLHCLEPLLDGSGYLYGDQTPGNPNIALLASTPGHPFARLCVERLPGSWPWRKGQILEETGPEFFRRTILEYIGNRQLQPTTDPRSGRLSGNRLDPPGKPALWALHPWVIYPYFLGESWQPAKHPDAYAVHHWQKSWDKG